MCSKQIITQNIHINIDTNIADGLYPAPFSGWAGWKSTSEIICTHVDKVYPSSSWAHTQTLLHIRVLEATALLQLLVQINTPPQPDGTHQVPQSNPNAFTSSDIQSLSHTCSSPLVLGTSLVHQLVSLIFSGAHTLTRTPTLAPVTAPGTQGPYARLSDPRCCTHSPVLARAHRTESFPRTDPWRNFTGRQDRLHWSSRAWTGKH